MNSLARSHSCTLGVANHYVSNQQHIQSHILGQRYKPGLYLHSAAAEVSDHVADDRDDEMKKKMLWRTQELGENSTGILRATPGSHKLP